MGLSFFMEQLAIRQEGQGRCCCCTWYYHDERLGGSRALRCSSNNNERAPAAAPGAIQLLCEKSTAFFFISLSLSLLPFYVILAHLS